MGKGQLLLALGLLAAPRGSLAQDSEEMAMLSTKVARGLQVGRGPTTGSSMQQVPQGGAPLRRVEQAGLTCDDVISPSHVTAIRNDDVENQLSYLGPQSTAPQVFQGIYWMDQTGYYQTRPDRPDQTGEYEVVPGNFSWYKTFPHNLPAAADELLLSFGPSVFNAETGCMAVSWGTDQWLWANTTGTAAGSITWADKANKGLFQFCFDEAMSEISILIQPCVGSGDLDRSSWMDMGQFAIPRPWGLERVNRHAGEIVTRYAAYQIVDGQGQRTQHYQAWLDFMQMQCWFTPQVQFTDVPFWNETSCTSHGGYGVNMGHGYSALGRHGPAP